MLYSTPPEQPLHLITHTPSFASLSWMTATLPKSKQQTYTANNVKSNTHSKAGNLNHGLDFIRTLPGFPSEFIAVLDVDRLRALLPHILQMKKS